VIDISDVTVSTERMVVRQVRRSDREEYLRMHEVSRDHFAAWSPAASAEAMFDREIDRVERADGLNARMVGIAADGRIAGLFAVSEIVRGFFQSGYASWSVSAEFKRQGYGTEGVRALLDLAFSKSGLQLHRVQANVIPSNIASIRLAERAGFRREGLAERYLKIADVWQDHVMFACTVEEHIFTYLPS
jgi:[ribosomal protein S5]-alanine N-acetyltransferase